jgi:hypothetical protein
MTNRFLWIPLLLYGAPNLLALAGARWLDILLVDMVPVALTANGSTLFSVLLAILFSFFFLTTCIVLACGFFRDRHQIISPPLIIGKIVFLLQLITIAALVFSDYGRAGVQPESIDTLSIIASYTKSDLFFMLYYSHQRPRKFPAINLSIYIVGNIIRGWAGMWIIIILIEIYYILERRRRRFPLKEVLALTFSGLLLFPVANFIKERVRGTEVESLSYLGSYFVLINRLQHSTNVALIAQEADGLISDYNAGRIMPWYVNSTLLYRISTAGRDIDNLPKFITKNYLVDKSSFDQFADDPFWYTNVGIAGWFFIIQWYHIPFYLLYLSVLVMAPYWLVARFLAARSMIPALHVASFVYVLHGWLEVQLTFLVCVAIYVAVVGSFRVFPKQAHHGSPGGGGGRSI